MPIVLYTGDDAWPVEIDLAAMMDLPAALERFNPKGEVLFLNLKATPPEALTKIASAMGWALRVLQAEKEPLGQIERVLHEAMQGIEALPQEQAGQWIRCAWFLLQLVFHRRSSSEVPALMRTVVSEAARSKFREDNEEATMQSYAEFQEKKGEARGLAIGELLGERKLLLAMASSRFGTPDTAILAKLDAVESHDVLLRLGERLTAVETWEELLRDV